MGMLFNYILFAERGFLLSQMAQKEILITIELLIVEWYFRLRNSKLCISWKQDRARVKRGTSVDEVFEEIRLTDSENTENH